MHVKRKTIPSFWPISRTGTKYMAVASHEKSSAIPLIIAMRDLLGLVRNKKEMKKILHDKKVLVNGKPVREQNFPLLLFDSLSIPSIKKNYKVVLAGKKFSLVEVSDKQAGTKICKVISKKILPGKKIQINLSGGKNILSSDKINTGDFLVLSHSDNKILSKIKLEKGIEVVVIKGKHTGKIGKITEISKQGENTVAGISGKEDIKVNVKNVFAVE